MNPDMFNNPDFMNQMNAMMQNPAMMSQMMAMMQNPEMMGQVNKMMQDPEMMNKVNGMMKPNTEKENKMKGPGDLNLNNILGKKEKKENNENTFVNGDKILLSNLNNQEYNNKEGIIRGYDQTKNRYLVYITGLDKEISVKEEKCQRIIESKQNTENTIENVD
jgi:hypothetical protein